MTVLLLVAAIVAGAIAFFAKSPSSTSGGWLRCSSWRLA